MSAMAFFSCTPLGEQESVSEYVAKVVQVVKDSGLAWKLTPMGTVVEGETLAEVLEVINRGVESLPECNRLSISIKVDYRRDRVGGLDKKVDAVMNRLR